jgi:hypothetical protein
LTTLRILLTDVPRADRAEAWALFADDGRVVRQGRDVPSAWPPAASTDAVLAAERARVVVLTLPPMARQRVAAAVAYALEDQLAATGAPPRIGVGAQQADGRVQAAIADGALIDALASFAHVVPEAALAPDSSAWTWHASAAGQGFVRTPAGAFAVTQQGPDVPAELAVAIAHAQRQETAPAAIEVAFDADPARLQRCAHVTGIAFVPASPWHWTRVPPERFTQAPDWHAPAPDARAASGTRARWFQPALVLASLALALHVGATLVQWAGYRWSAWRVGRDTVALAERAGIVDATTPAAAASALVRRNNDARHRAGQMARSDALPLLAGAAPVLAQLPPGALKSAVYGDGAWTLELGRADAVMLAAIERGLAARGIVVLHAPTASGLRMRLTTGP